MNKKYALIGKNIQDSLSPVIHSAYGCQYDLLDVEENKLEWALSQPYDGFNVTSPYKEKIMQYLDIYQATPVNTICKDDGILKGYNTDIKGFNRAMEIVGINQNCKIGIIGKGVMSGLLQSILRNCDVFDSRTEKINFAGCYGIINCSPRQDFDLSTLSKSAWVMDLGYKDATFIDNARNRGHFAFNGMGMLLAQAEESQKIWNS